MLSLQPVKRAAIIGAGQMGMGIAYVTALHARVPLTLHDPSPLVLSSALKKLQSLFSRDVDKKRISAEDGEAAMSRIKGVEGDLVGGSLGLEGDTDLVIEAIPEIPTLKLALFQNLAKILPAPAILGSNTSSISLTKLAAAAGSASGKGPTDAESLESASRLVGIHFFNPVPQMRLVEIIPALQTSQETLERAKAFGLACKKEIAVSKDSPGFIANAILMPMINEAILTLEKLSSHPLFPVSADQHPSVLSEDSANTQGIASPEDIDKTFRLGMGHPMGPLALADLIGLDTCLAIQRVLHNESGDSKYRPAGLLVRMVDAGWVGRKGGKGFYEYPV